MHFAGRIACDTAESISENCFLIFTYPPYPDD